MDNEVNPLEPQSFNMEIGFGSRDKLTNIYPLALQMNVEKKPINRFKYWMLCKFFPFTIKEWSK